MIEINIPKDINKYESKTIGPFTTRQAICFVLGAGLAILIYNISSGIVSSDTSGFLCFISFVPFALCGWYKPYGMHFEKFAKAVIISNFLTPKYRKYKTENSYLIENEIIKKEENEEKTQEQRKNDIKKIKESRKKRKINQKKKDTDLYAYK